MADKRSRRGGDLPGDYASEYERGLQQRIFREVTEFPLEFRNWLKRFIDDTVNESKSLGGSGPGGATGFNPADWMPGIIIPMASPAAPLFSLYCDGREVSRTTYAALYASYGDLWGAGDGSTTFNLPDLRDRALYGQGTTVGMAATDLGALGTRGPKHSHIFSGGATNDPGGHTHGGVTGNNGSHSHGGGTGGGGDHFHEGQTSETGSHTHAPPSAQFAISNGGTYVVNSSSGTSRILVTGVAAETGWVGSHAHNITTNTNGDHSHGINSDGDHNHSIPSGGGHTHTVTGLISGGGVQDTPGFAGVYYVVTTGAIT